MHPCLAVKSEVFPSNMYEICLVYRGVYLKKNLLLHRCLFFKDPKNMTMILPVSSMACDWINKVIYCKRSLYSLRREKFPTYHRRVVHTNKKAKDTKN
jgi:hypothetical protein